MFKVAKANPDNARRQGDFEVMKLRLDGDCCVKRPRSRSVACAGVIPAWLLMRVEPPGEPDALDDRQASAVERAAAWRGARDRAMVAVLLYSGARVEACARLVVRDVVVTARTGVVRLHGKGDQVCEVPLPAAARAAVLDYLADRGREDGPLWLGQRGPLGISGITAVVLAAGLPDLRPHRLRHT